MTVRALAWRLRIHMYLFNDLPVFPEDKASSPGPGHGLLVGSGLLTAPFLLLLRCHNTLAWRPARRL